MNNNIEDFFGTMVFNDYTMKKSLPKTIYESLNKSITENLPLKSDVADVVAVAMRDWAIEKGATHFTHWFQPMTNITAGKLDSFISLQKDGNVIIDFSGKELIKGEPDASSFPNGGIRNTFEARGYTAWDCTSPAFVRDQTLYIPTTFCSYTGEALDTKTPLLRSMEVISKQAMRLISIFGTTAKSVFPTVGAEQEYFLIDRSKYEKRLDLKICGRTLFGNKSIKGQEMGDHYFGRIKLRVSNFMKELDEELWRLGVPSKTKHNEVAPAQHELAPIFTKANIACDNNQIIMETMRIVAKKNGLACLLHEKPFKDINGSGKHNNWSLSTDEGVNLFEPGNSPYENMQFLLFLCSVIKAVDEYGDLLLTAISTAGNDHRLGSSEAPPSIISIFLGDDLKNILNDISNGNDNSSYNCDFLKTGISTAPSLTKDNSDRNRTSPFAFTGNKFEFRMVGSSASVAFSTYIINTIVAKSLNYIADRLENCENFDLEVKSIIRDIIKDHKNVIFNGNNYTQSWIQLAKNRNLYVSENTVDSIENFISKKNISILEEFNILSKSEIYSRYEIMLENYCNTIHIEANTIIDIVNKQILPSSIKYMGDLSFSYNQTKIAGVTNMYTKDLIFKISENINFISNQIKNLSDFISNYGYESPIEKATHYRDIIGPNINLVRKYADELEEIVDSKTWDIPGYTDILYNI